MSVMTIEQHSFHALKEGKHFVVFGAVHGNERCGTTAIRRAIAALQSGELTLLQGRVTFVPICNPRAYAENTRFIDRNLNRHFYPKAERVAYEDHIDPILCALLNDADVLLDLHSYQSEGGAFCFLGGAQAAEIAYARALGVETFIYGWADAFNRNATEEQRLASIGTTDSIRANGRGGIAVTLECGNHHDPHAADVGYAAILRALAHFDMVAHTLPPFPLESQRCIRMQSVFYKEKAGTLVLPWRHTDNVSEGKLIACYEDGDNITAPSDGVLVLPKANPDHAVGAEWFYFGTETDFPTGA
jgi:predicted deacylase